MILLPHVTGCRLAATRWALVLLLACVAGCQRETIQVYQVPKEVPPPQTAAQAHGHGHNHEPSAAGHVPIHYLAPEGWTEKPAGGMRVARFSVPGIEGQETDVSVIPLSGITASKEDIVNMWREQIGLSKAKEAELDGLVEKVVIGQSQGELFDMLSPQPLIEAKHKVRILVAMSKEGNTTWFFKMTGEDGSVQGQKTAFVNFLKSVTFDASAGAGAPAVAATSPSASPSTASQITAADSATPGKPDWHVPTGWEEVPPTQMLVAKFAIGGKTGGKGEVTVSVFPGDVGGLLANVNRWRRQIGLPPIEEKDLPQATQSVDVLGGKATLVELTGQDPKTAQKTRVLGVIIPQGERTWFYKFMGDEQLAAQEKPAFIKFVQSAQHPNA